MAKALILALAVFGLAFASVAIQVTSSNLPDGCWLKGEEISLGRAPRGSKISGEIVTAMRARRNGLSQAVILIANLEELRINEAYLKAVKEQAQALIVYDRDMDGDKVKAILLGQIPVVGISQRDAERIEEEGSFVTIVFSTESDLYLTVTLVVDGSGGSLNSELAGVLAAFWEVIPVRIWYQVPLSNLAYLQDTKKSVTEVVRQKCILRLYGHSTYLSYLKSWVEGSSERSKADLRSANISETDLDHCIETKSVAFNQNAYLQELDTTDSLLPSLTISGLRYHGDLTTESISKFICTIHPLHCSTNFTSKTRTLQFDECNINCSPSDLLSNSCYPECDNPACEYGNWACRCAPDCPPNLLNNYECNLPCNTTRCDYDHAQCLPVYIPPPVNNSEAIVEEKSHDENEKRMIWLIIACCGVFFV